MRWITSGEAIGKASGTDQSIKALIELALERFQISCRIQGAVDRLSFGHCLKYVLCTIDFGLVQKKVLTPYDDRGRTLGTDPDGFGLGLAHSSICIL